MRGRTDSSFLGRRAGDQHVLKVARNGSQTDSPDLSVEADED